MLNHYSYLVLLTTNTVTKTPALIKLQSQTQRDLHSRYPYHRTKWLHNIEYARSLLLQLEHTAQQIRVATAKRAALTDLAQKRMVVKKLRRRVEDIGREVEVAQQQRRGSGRGTWMNGDGGEWDNAEEEGETLEQILLSQQQARRSGGEVDLSADVKEGKTVRIIEPGDDDETDDGQQNQQTPHSQRQPQSSFASSSHPISQTSAREALFSSSSTLRNRNRHHPSSSPSTDPATTESTLLTSDRTHDSLTASLLSLTSQLKSQSLTFSSALSTDQTYLSRALSSLDSNISSMETAIKRMAFVRRMSEGQGWWGRIKLYVMIVGMWVGLVLLVFVGPKLRF